MAGAPAIYEHAFCRALTEQAERYGLAYRALVDELGSVELANSLAPLTLPGMVRNAHHLAMNASSDASDGMVLRLELGREFINPDNQELTEDS